MGSTNNEKDKNGKKPTDKSDNLIYGSEDNIVNALEGDDTVKVGSGDDILNGGEGDDILNGGEGDDQLFGGDGDDFLEGVLENDELKAGERDTLTGGLGKNIFSAGDQEGNFYGTEGRELTITDFSESVDNRIQLWGGEEYEMVSLDDGSGLGIFSASDSSKMYAVLEGLDDSASLMVSDDGNLTFIEFDV